MSPVLSERTRKRCSGHTASPRLRKHVRCKDMDEENEVTREKRELAKTIAEFRVGVSSSSSSSCLDMPFSEDIVCSGNLYDKETAPSHTVTDILTPSRKDQRPSFITPEDGSSPFRHMDKGATTNITAPHGDSPIPPFHAQALSRVEPAAEPSGAAPAATPSGPKPPSSRRRRGFTACETELLEAAFHIADNPGSATMKLLVHLTGLEKKKIRGWFRTRRDRKEREEAKAVGSPSTTTQSADTKPEPHVAVPPQYWPEPLRHIHACASQCGMYLTPGYSLPTVTQYPSVPFASLPPSLPRVYPAGFALSPAAMPPAAIPSAGTVPQPHPSTSSSTRPPHHQALSTTGAFRGCSCSDCLKPGAPQTRPAAALPPAPCMPYLVPWVMVPATLPHPPNGVQGEPSATSQ